MKKILLSGLLAVMLAISFGTQALALCVSAPEANLRGGPGTKYEKRWLVFKYTALKKIAKRKGWYKVRDVDGDVHWIFGRLVTDRYRCAVVKVEKANVRIGPGTRFKKSAMSPAIKYDSFKVIRRKGEWVKVMDEFGDKGWIHRKLLWIQ
ncbi:MAG TPA: hypothetical protein ENJ04_01145 [Nitrospirae bacterium]|nr:hypothetical protein [Nitrospirota bacterium]